MSATKTVWVQVTERTVRFWKVEVPVSASDDDIVDCFWDTDCGSADPNANDIIDAEVEVFGERPSHVSRLQHDDTIDFDEDWWGPTDQRDAGTAPSVEG